MASAKLIRAMAEGRVIVQRAPKVGGEVMLTFKPLVNRKTGAREQPASIMLSNYKPVDPMKRSDVTIEHLKNSNLSDLVRRGAVIIL